MRVNKLGTVISFFLAVGAGGCSEDETPAPTPDSGNPMDTGGTPDDGGADAPQGDMRPCEASTIVNGNGMLTYQTDTYRYIVHLPASYDGTKRTPLLLNWHGIGSNGGEQEIYSGTSRLAETENFIVVYPTSPDKSWTAGNCCWRDDGGRPDRDDFGFAKALVSEITKAACIDEKRIYTTGMSNGGFMSHRLACDAADLFAAAVSVAGQMPDETCQPSRPMPILQFHGTADATVSYDMPGGSAEGTNVPDMMSNWAKRNGCTKGPDTTFQMGVVTCQTWSQCRGGALVRLCTEEGVGHCWPGAGFCPGGNPTTDDISATVDGWAFMKQFVLP
jgi:polyhydroxybutyrate depolymerase